MNNKVGHLAARRGRHLGVLQMVCCLHFATVMYFQRIFGVRFFAVGLCLAAAACALDSAEESSELAQQLELERVQFHPVIDHEEVQDDGSFAKVKTGDKISNPIISSTGEFYVVMGRGGLEPMTALVKIELSYKLSEIRRSAKILALSPSVSRSLWDTGIGTLWALDNQKAVVSGTDARSPLVTLSLQTGKVLGAVDRGLAQEFVKDQNKENRLQIIVENDALVAFKDVTFKDLLLSIIPDGDPNLLVLLPKHGTTMGIIMHAKGTPNDRLLAPAPGPR